MLTKLIRAALAVALIFAVPASAGPLLNSYLAAAPAGITFVAVGTVRNQDTATSISPTYPAGIQSDDVAILTVLATDSSSSPGSQTVTTPAGWTLIRAIPQTTIPSIVTSYGGIYWKRLTGSESGSVAVSISETSNTYPVGAAITVWRGVLSSGTPVEGDAHRVNGATTSQNANAVTTTGNNRMVLSFYQGCLTGSTGTPTAPATEVFDMNDTTGGGGQCNFSGYYKLAPTSGAQTAINRTAGSSGFLSVSVALIPN